MTKKIGKVKRNNVLIVSLILAMIIVCMAVLCSCVKTPTENITPKKEYTLSFVTNGGSEVAPITALAGASLPTVSNPTKSDENGTYIFRGWYLNADFSGESVLIPDKMPSEDITYYALFELDDKKEDTLVTIEYNINLTDITHTPIEDGKTNDIYSYRTVDGSAFEVDGYLFLCWTTKPNGAFSLSGTKEKGQYYANEIINSNEKNITLYAHWAKEYNDAYNKSNDKIYVCDELIGKGLGASILVREGKENKLGFVDSEKLFDYGYSEFTFYFDDSEGGIVSGRLYSENQTYAFPDGAKGEYLKYNYEIKDLDTSFILVLDGFGSSMILKMVGSQTSVYYYGVYEYDEKYGDYAFVVLDPITQSPVVDEYGNVSMLHFTFTKERIENTEFDGIFMVQGGESGSYMLYDNGDLYDYRLDLSGYGLAHIYVYDPTKDATELLAIGEYIATENYESVFGEWKFVSNSSDFGSFKFILSYISGGEDYIMIYIEYNSELNETYSDKSGNGDTLYLDGYGGAMYISNSLVMEGNCTVGTNLVTFVPYTEDENGNYVVGNKLYFNIDVDTLTFSVNSDGFILDGTTIVKYEGESDIVVIPDDVTAIGDNAFNYTYTDTSLVSVTIPENVVSIGKHAFQNGYTLQRAVFLSETPIDIDWSSDYDPFRWGAGNFVIIVPEGTQEAYKTAWGGCKYVIKGSYEITIVPEFEIVDGVLVSYNKQSDSADELDIRIPDEVTEIANNVFRGLNYIRSVDFNNVVKIGEYAFYENTALVSATFTNVQVVGHGAFIGCYNLGSENNGLIELLAVTHIGDSSFASCESLKLVRLGENLVEIGNQAFTECQIYYGEDPLFIELLGENPPEMGGKISVGNISFKIKLQNIDVAIKCFDSPTWNSYNKHLYIDSGSEKGIYMSGTDKLLLDGRAEFFDSELMMYSVDSGYITFYWYDSETATYDVLLGQINSEKVTLKFGASEYVFTKANGVQTYTSANGKYTLECNPLELMPDAYEETGYVGVADGTLNGKPVKITVSGYNTKVIKGYVENGKTYNFSFILDGDTLVYEMKLADSYIRNIKASDGSEINLHVSGSLTYVFGTLNIEVAEGTIMPSWGDYGTVVTDLGNNVYKFTRDYRGTTYQITITISEDYSSFTYEYNIA